MHVCAHIVQTTALIVAGNMVLGLLAAGHVHSMLHWLAPQNCNGPGDSSADHSLCGDPCVACVAAIQAPQKPTDSIYAPPLGLHLPELQVL